LCFRNLQTFKELHAFENDAQRITIGFPPTLQVNDLELLHHLSYWLDLSLVIFEYKGQQPIHMFRTHIDAVAYLC
jgi:hypothetical protein